MYKYKSVLVVVLRLKYPTGFLLILLYWKRRQSGDFQIGIQTRQISYSWTYFVPVLASTSTFKNMYSTDKGLPRYELRYSTPVASNKGSLLSTSTSFGRKIPWYSVLIWFKCLREGVYLGIETLLASSSRGLVTITWYYCSPWRVQYAERLPYTTYGPLGGWFVAHSTLE
jgi:hypothetical protein